MVRRICIFGGCGAGKTHLMQRISDKFGHLAVSGDAYMLMANGRHDPKQEPLFAEAMLNNTSWVVEGHLGGVLPIACQRADLVVWLDTPRGLRIRRVMHWMFVAPLTALTRAPSIRVNRVARSRLKYALRSDDTLAAIVAARLKHVPGSTPIIRLRKPEEADRLIAALQVPGASAESVSGQFTKVRPQPTTTSAG